MEENEASGEVAELYEHFRSHFGRPDVPGILKCFATHPPMLRHMMDLAESLLFADGHLNRRHKEMIATFVSTLNACVYCADSHGYFLRMHGGSSELLCALQQNDIASSTLTTAEQALLKFAARVNDDSQEIRAIEIDVLKQAGWDEAQIAEAIHIVALFATFNRVANAFGLSSQGLLRSMQDETVIANENAIESNGSIQ
ncbi:carboxymuconolactone decarboxylase family protein [Acidicapsa ligni]|uniref:carboxymuconolactone decarboxylase family protein n=1 Tax=Acidicapsa ligni TaxID=542300 RepID=UPI0021E05463|nr:peroxidase-related enzyme [Acidicapsa ligni]